MGIRLAKRTEAQKWLDDNAYKASLMYNQIRSLRPDIGYFIKVEGIEISEQVFPEEFKIICTEFNKVLDKMEKHHKQLTKNKPIDLSFFNRIFNRC